MQPDSLRPVLTDGQPVTPRGMLQGMNVVTTPDHPRQYLTVAEVAAELACSEPTVRRASGPGSCPP
jgi:hypothetical protein